MGSQQPVTAQIDTDTNPSVLKLLTGCSSTKVTTENKKQKNNSEGINVNSNSSSNENNGNIDANLKDKGFMKSEEYGEPMDASTTIFEEKINGFNNPNDNTKTSFLNGDDEVLLEKPSNIDKDSIHDDFKTTPFDKTSV